MSLKKMIPNKFKFVSLSSGKYIIMYLYEETDDFIQMEVPEQTTLTDCIEACNEWFRQQSL